MLKVNYNGEEVQLVQSRYTKNDTLYVGLVDKDGEFYGDVTVNLPNSGTLPNECAFVDSNNLPFDLLVLLMEEGIIKSIGQSACSGFCRYTAYQFLRLSEINDIDSVIN